MTVDKQRRAVGVLAGDPGDYARPAGMGFQDGRFQADLGQQGGDVFGRPALARARVITTVAGVDPDQVAADGRDLVFAGNGWTG